MYGVMHWQLRRKQLFFDLFRRMQSLVYYDLQHPMFKSVL